MAEFLDLLADRADMEAALAKKDAEIEQLKSERDEITTDGFDGRQDLRAQLAAAEKRIDALENQIDRYESAAEDKRFF